MAHRKSGRRRGLAKKRIIAARGNYAYAYGNYGETYVPVSTRSSQMLPGWGAASINHMVGAGYTGDLQVSKQGRTLQGSFNVSMGNVGGRHGGVGPRGRMKVTRLPGRAVGARFTLPPSVERMYEDCYQQGGWAGVAACVRARMKKSRRRGRRLVG